MALAAGYYWYKGPTVPDEQIKTAPDDEWSIVKANGDGNIAFIGTDSDADDVDSALMVKHGKFVPIQPPHSLVNEHDR
jgi:hypothetical protein